MKTLSIKSPWAYYIAAGVQKIEKRSWNTDIRGTIYIHATGENRDLLDYLVDGSTPLFEECNKIYSQKKKDFVFSGNEKHIRETENGRISLPETKEAMLFLWGWKRILEEKAGYPVNAIIGTVDIVDCIQDGNEFLFVLENASLFDKPITNVKGRLKLWDFSK